MIKFHPTIKLALEFGVISDLKVYRRDFQFKLRGESDLQHHVFSYDKDFEANLAEIINQIEAVFKDYKVEPINVVSPNLKVNGLKVSFTYKGTKVTEYLFDSNDLKAKVLQIFYQIDNQLYQVPEIRKICENLSSLYTKGLLRTGEENLFQFFEIYRNGTHDPVIIYNESSFQIFHDGYQWELWLIIEALIEFVDSQNHTVITLEPLSSTPKIFLHQGQIEGIFRISNFGPEMIAMESKLGHWELRSRSDFKVNLRLSKIVDLQRDLLTVGFQMAKLDKSDEKYLMITKSLEKGYPVVEAYHTLKNLL